MKHKNGFTIVELLIAIVIIGILAGLALNSYSKAQEKARIASATNGITAIYKAVKLLESDTGRSGFGCPADGTSHNPDGPINRNNAGILTSPVAGVVDSDTDCEWSTGVDAYWNGPYMDSGLDPWKNDYKLDYDYAWCINGQGKRVPVALSKGPNDTTNYPTSATSGACTITASDDLYRVLY
jgi:prepilin-type N-terminal cleavage/methylation domain-containing protein